MLYLLHQHNKIAKKSLQQFNELILIMVENLIAIRDPKTFCFIDVDENWTHNS